MENYTAKSNAFTNKCIALINKLRTDLARLKVQRMLDEDLCRTLNSFDVQLKNLNILCQENPRLGLVMVQNEMDRGYNEDKSITGFFICYDFVDVPAGEERRIVINCKIRKVS